MAITSHPGGARRRLLLGAAGAGVLFAAPSLRAQGGRWPDKPVRLIVGFPAGTSPDLLARAIGEPLAAQFAQPFVVENRSGANGNIGAAAVAKATDAHTFGIVGAGALTSSPTLYANPGFKLAEFAPVSVIGTSPLMLVASTQVAVGSVREFLAEARKGGNRWSYGSPGVGSNGHLCMELLKDKVGLDAVHVPYAGVPAVLTAIMAGDIQMAIVPLGNALVQVQAGRLKAVGLTSSGPSPLAPGVPALADGGVQDFVIESWNAVMAPASTPAGVLATFGDAVRALLRSEAMKQKLFSQGWQADGGAPDALQRRIAADSAMYSRIIAARGIRLES
jgi:tripartite-type tricarboxylate transporter receptor subunit TctC